MPIHVAQDLHASATALAAYYTAFGIGAVIGGLATGYLRRWPLWPTTIGIVLAFGAAMLPLGLGAPTGMALTSFAIAGTKKPGNRGDDYEMLRARTSQIDPWERFAP
jgi:predicted MFS family arabinose efflux permease